MTSSFRSVEGAYLALLTQATDQYEQHIAARGNEAHEVIGVGFRLSDPRQRLAYLVTRKVNPVFQFAEALWHLAGRRDLEMIGHYAPSMRSSSVDGASLHGSSYGHTLFNPADGDTVSPFDRVLELLRTETDSKRGYLPVFSAAELAVSDNPDVACLAGLHLLARGGRLHMVCNMRANDLDRGLLSDVFSFTMIQEYAAVQLGLELGAYTHFIGSAHVNDRDSERVKKVLDEADLRRHPQHFPFPAMPAETTPGVIARVLEHEELLRTDTVRYSADDIAQLDMHAYWQQAVLLFEVHRQVQHERTATVSRDVLDALHPGLRWLLGHRWSSFAAEGAER
ncbi:MULTISPECIES: thymidylate synthase [unclassified Streptomyces]|uniref:thymidylate synthase n=1 Tax=unclassified Streptomyces TaxID=2593676 RepID=UPI002DD8344B|nr:MULTISPECIES: thymidylate synthase [unclassified Streptomyces]WSA97502.1 thymidylate synthase [Streptomyces sp. NBC_01795]WSB81930.1 thymidylate synthase [Streptomyces sp. NBC_01775]WSS17311.1 thymidylate synthase [Streptomyces sp. NBC_01186]WSS46053.1 thymidylate synthase [Streptomyces sp. NBC_01187]